VAYVQAGVPASQKQANGHELTKRTKRGRGQDAEDERNSQGVRRLTGRSATATTDALALDAGFALAAVAERRKTRAMSKLAESAIDVRPDTTLRLTSVAYSQAGVPAHSTEREK
jgi:hypothetical protein